MRDPHEKYKKMKPKVYDPVKEPITPKEVDAVVEILKTATTRHIDVDCIKYPIRSIVGQSRQDLRMGQLRRELEFMGIMADNCGIMSLAERPAFYYMTNLTLTKEWFEENCAFANVRFTPNTNQTALF